MNLLVDGTMAVGAFMGIFFSLLILTKKQKGYSDYILSAVFLLMGATILLRHAEMLNREFGYPYPWLVKISTPLLLLQGPILWRYVKSMVVPDSRLTFSSILHVVPFALAVGVLAVKVYFLPANLKVATDAASGYKLGFVVLLVMLSNVGYYLWGIYLLRQFKRKSGAGSSALLRENLWWLQFFLVASVLSVGVLCIVNYADYLFDFIGTLLLEKLAFACSSAYIVVVGFFGLRLNRIAGGGDEGERTTVISFGVGSDAIHAPAESKASKDETEFILNLVRYMEVHKPYVEHELTIADLSARLSVSADYLSSIINGRLGKNFFELVNGYRIAEFKRICAQKDHRRYTLSAIASECGFNSRATFNRVFKNSEGISPSEYLAMIDEKANRKPFSFENGMVAV